MDDIKDMDVVILAMAYDEFNSMNKEDVGLYGAGKSYWM